MPTDYQFSNFAKGTLVNDITASGLTFELSTADTALFPTLASGEAFRATLFDGTNDPEIVECTSISSNTFTITRGKEGTSAAAWNAGTKIVNTLTAETIKSIVLANVAITGGSITGITDLAIADGGTAAGTATQALANLGGQTVNVNLTGLSGLTSAANKLPYFTASGGAAALTTLSTFGRTLIDDATASAARTTLGLGAVSVLAEIGTVNLATGAVTAVKLAETYMTETADVAEETTAFNLAASHAGQSVYVTATSEVICSITATAITAGFQCEFVQAAAGKVRIALATGSGKTLTAMDNFVSTTDTGKRLFLQARTASQIFLEGGQEV